MWLTRRAMHPAIIAIVIGLGVTAAIRFFLSGKELGGWALPALLGVGGALLGGLIGQWLGFGGWFGVFALPLLCALAPLLVYHGIVFRSGRPLR